MILSEPFQSGNYYHVYNRGNNKEQLFRERKNYEYFLRLSAKHLLPHLEIHAYCLLSNHFHFLVRIKEEGEPDLCLKAFSNLFNAYAKAYNKYYNRTGRLFQERFKRKFVEKDDYLTQLIAYIHLNPDKHELRQGYLTYPYSSYQAILMDADSIVEKFRVLEWFGGQEEYEKFHRDYLNLSGFQNPRGFLE